MPHARKPKKNVPGQAGDGQRPVTLMTASEGGGSTKKRLRENANEIEKKRAGLESERTTSMKNDKTTGSKRTRHDEETDLGDHALNSGAKAVAHVKGERIQVQTRVSHLSHNMNRPSVLVRLDASDFAEVFQRLWEEHVPGFTGLRGSKRERTEKEKQMEWRQRVAALKEKKPSAEGEVKKNGQTVSEKDRMFAIERYRALKAAKGGSTVKIEG